MASQESIQSNPSQTIGTDPLSPMAKKRIANPVKLPNQFSLPSVTGNVGSITVRGLWKKPTGEDHLDNLYKSLPRISERLSPASPQDYGEETNQENDWLKTMENML